MGYSVPFSGPPNTAVDLREDGLEPFYQKAPGADAACSLALVAMLDWQERKWTGTRIDASASFLHQMTKRVAGGGGMQGISLRSLLKTLTRFGAPPERLWPSFPEAFHKSPKNPELFCFAGPFRDLQYIRLDAWTYQPIDRLAAIRRWIAEGNPCLLGFAVPSTMLMQDSSTIPFDDRGGTTGGTACIVLGYDDHFALPIHIRHPLVNEKWRRQGALLVKTVWNEWGSAGYVWLPYAFVFSRFACDAWGVMHPNWS